MNALLKRARSKGVVVGMTTAKLRRSTMARLVGLKNYPSETVDSVVTRLVEKEKGCGDCNGK